jgi:signal transduction histidine kinase/CheY-like chemotaxis protein
LALTGILIAFWIAMRHVSTITTPLTELAASFADIGNRTDLSQRITRKSDDEVGILVDAFNNMFDRIAERDDNLQAHRDSLEETVEIRTADLVLAKNEAERANAAKSEFLAMVGHEIRTPMNGMMVMAEMLAAAPLSPRHLRYAEIINRSGRNLLTIINDILDMSKIEAGRLELESVPFSIDSMIDDTVGLFAERARENSLSLAFVIDPDVPLLVLGDVTRLNQVITNLVNNALKFTESGGVIVKVTSRSTNGGWANIVFSVTDTGIGIAKDKLELVFERFAQGDQSITRRFGGTGLGLSISRRLVEAMHGEISVASIEGSGSTFTVKVALKIEKPASRNVSFQGRRIALFHNEAIYGHALKSALESMDALVVDAANLQPDTRLDAFFATDEGFASPASFSQVPLFRLVPRLGVTRGANSLDQIKLEFPFPARRAELNQLAQAFEQKDFAQFSISTSSEIDAQILPEFPGLRALVVDDNVVNREVLAEALQQMGATLSFACNGQEALEVMRNQPLDIVFMDCSMPVMDGFAATRQWRAAEAGKILPIIALTAYSEATAKEDWKTAGMNGFITKPFTIPAIADAITATSGRRASKDMTVTVKNMSPIVRAAQDVELLDTQTLSMIDLLSKKEGGTVSNRIFGLFLKHGAEGLANLQEAVLNGVDEEIKPLAHALNSMCSSAGASRLAFMCSQMESLSSASQASQSQLMEAMETTMFQTIAALEARMKVGNGGEEELGCTG